ncbi:MAG: ParA family protein [Desulfuromonadales bacterium]|nr:MAG: ParA family protein [Desulfuromonadales bacterium]
MMIIASYSIKGGVGKTALSVNLSYALSEAGQRTLLIDLDPQGAAEFYFRVSSAEKFRMNDTRTLWGGLLRNVRETDFSGLDIIPSNLAYRHFDIALDSMEKRRKQLRRVLEKFSEDYDTIVLDCPPNITLLSENVFRASDMILVPVIPTILSQRTLEQLDSFFRDEELPVERLRPFFSMVQKRNNMHRDTISELSASFPQFLKTTIPFSADVEKMGLRRMPLLAYSRACDAAQAYRALCNEIIALQETVS